ncbi:MAG: metallophosphoesterase [Bacteroidetes bacterium]|nr:metallophosphoesterase [Bacteroidota bacterium]MBU1577950.1 metallophosphoesterase [Bacteroidota bacterium]MBU2556565.1 metallophosphoesterase [Bacteroidota bacterium]
MPSIRFSLLLLTILMTIAACQDTGNRNNSDANEFDVVFMTDVHVLDESDVLQGYAQAIKEVNALNPDFVINGGDMIMDALKVPYDTAARLLYLFDSVTSMLETPFYPTIGNHDIFAWYFGDSLKSHPAYGKQFYTQNFSKAYYTIDHQNWRFFFLDGITKTPEHKYIGQIDSLQMQWLQNVLDTTSSDKQLAIVSHIPFITTGYQIWKGALEPNPPHGVVENSTRVLELFKNHQLQLVLQGHLHIYEKVFINDIWFITGGAVSSRWWQGKNKGLEEGFLKLKLGNSGVIDASYHPFDWEVNQTQ